MVGIKQQGRKGLDTKQWTREPQRYACSTLQAMPRGAPEAANFVILPSQNDQEELLALDTMLSLETP